jgi:predicted nucleotidyltransferase component of viral defense system
VRYETPAAFRAALEDRLKTRSAETGISLSRLRKSVVFDRLLARLVEVAAGRWVLKGALALEFRFGSRTRTTNDIDLGRADNESASTNDFIGAQSAELGDHFVFAIQRTDRLDELEDAAAIRYHVSCELAGRAFDEIRVDVAFGSPELNDPETLRGPDLLDFADIKPVEVPAIPLPRHVAEKLHAYTRVYGRSGRPSSRVKDLIDLALIAGEARLNADELRQELRATFATRGTHDLPTALPQAPMDWAVPFRKLAREVGISDTIEDGHSVAALMLDPILRGTVTHGTWDPSGRVWRES